MLFSKGNNGTVRYLIAIKQSSERQKEFQEKQCYKTIFLPCLWGFVPRLNCPCSLLCWGSSFRGRSPARPQENRITLRSHTATSYSAGQKHKAVRKGRDRESCRASSAQAVLLLEELTRGQQTGPSAQLRAVLGCSSAACRDTPGALLQNCPRNGLRVTQQGLPCSDGAGTDGTDAPGKISEGCRAAGRGGNPNSGTGSYHQRALKYCSC